MWVSKTKALSYTMLLLLLHLVTLQLLLPHLMALLFMAQGQCQALKEGKCPAVCCMWLVPDTPQMYRCQLIYFQAA